MGCITRAFQVIAHFSHGTDHPRILAVARPSTMTPNTNASRSPHVSIAIFAWNEERVLARMLGSLFSQSLFASLRRQQRHCEILCVANGCTDATCRIAEQVFSQQNRTHPAAEAFTTSVVNLSERGKVNAWNQYVHSLSARGAQFLVFMDADIVFRQTDTLWNMLQVLETDPRANIAVDRPRKDIEFKTNKSWRDRLSLAAAQMTGAAEAQLCAQLYAIRAACARNIYLPNDLCACEDGFLKALVCTDFLTHPVWPERLQTAPEAEHVFEAYTSPLAILKNQKRQIIGQTMVHILVDKFLRGLSPQADHSLAQTLQAKDATDPPWLKRLLAEHLRNTPFPWRLYPGLAAQRFRHLAKMSLPRRLTCLPAAAAASVATLLASFLAWRALKTGSIDYWPRAPRPIQYQPSTIHSI